MGSGKTLLLEGRWFSVSGVAPFHGSGLVSGVGDNVRAGVNLAVDGKLAKMRFFERFVEGRFCNSHLAPVRRRDATQTC